MDLTTFHVCSDRSTTAGQVDIISHRKSSNGRSAAVEWESNGCRIEVES